MNSMESQPPGLSIFLSTPQRAYDTTNACTHAYLHAQEDHDITLPQYNTFYTRREVGAPPRSFTELRAVASVVAAGADDDLFFRGQIVKGRTCSQNIRNWVADYCAGPDVKNPAKAFEGSNGIEAHSLHNCTTSGSVHAVWSLCPAGWACWSLRLYDILSVARSIPVNMADPMVMPFERFLHWPNFTARVRTEGLTAMQDDAATAKTGAAADAIAREARRANALVEEMHRQAYTFREACRVRSAEYASLYDGLYDAMQDGLNKAAAGNQDNKGNNHNHRNDNNDERDDDGGYEYRPASWEEAVQGDACLAHPITRTLNAMFHARTWLSFEPGVQRSSTALFLLELACRLPNATANVALTQACAFGYNDAKWSYKSHVRGAGALNDDDEPDEPDDLHPPTKAPRWKRKTWPPGAAGGRD
jgi:hypothetical protein